MASEVEIEFNEWLSAIADERAGAKRKENEFSRKGLSLTELTDILEKGETTEKMAAARLLGKTHDGAAVIALVDALEQNRNNLLAGLEIVRVLKNIHTTEVVSGFFHRLFDDSDEFLKSECRLAIGQRGRRAIERIEIEPHTAQFHKLMQEHGITMAEAQAEIDGIKQLVRERHSREELKAMEQEMSHQHARHQQKKKDQPQRQHNQHKPKNRT